MEIKHLAVPTLNCTRFWHGWSIHRWTNSETGKPTWRHWTISTPKRAIFIHFKD